MSFSNDNNDNTGTPIFNFDNSNNTGFCGTGSPFESSRSTFGSGFPSSFEVVNNNNNNSNESEVSPIEAAIAKTIEYDAIIRLKNAQFELRQRRKNINRNQRAEKTRLQREEAQRRKAENIRSERAAEKEPEQKRIREFNQEFDRLEHEFDMVKLREGMEHDRDVRTCGMEQKNDEAKILYEFNLLRARKELEIAESNARFEQETAEIEATVEAETSKIENEMALELAQTCSDFNSQIRELKAARNAATAAIKTQTKLRMFQAQCRSDAKQTEAETEHQLEMAKLVSELTLINQREEVEGAQIERRLVETYGVKLADKFFENGETLRINAQRNAKKQTEASNINQLFKIFPIHI